MGRTIRVQLIWLKDDAPYCRTVTEIKEDVTKQCGRNPLSRLIRAKTDKDKIAAWRAELNRILQIFNVRLATSLLAPLTIRSQTELAIDTNVAVSNTNNIVSNTNNIVSNTHNVVSETHNIVSDIHRTIIKQQEGYDGPNPPVSNYYPARS